MITKIKIFGRNSYCQVCGKWIKNFNPLPNMYAENAKKNGYAYFGTGEMTSLDTYFCGHCNSSDRERLYAYYIKKNFSGKENIVFYHFAPEKNLQAFIKRFFRNIIYKTFDLCAPDVDCHADLTDMNMIKDNECDFFICSHMLEHIENDRKAIAELYRITKYGGKGILMAPISTAIESTIENLPDVKTDEDRWKYYGQNDHIRLYARKEFVERITQSGFELEMYDIDNLGKSFLKKNGLKETTVLYIVKKK